MFVLFSILIVAVVIHLLFVNLNLNRKYCIEYGKVLLLEKDLGNKISELKKVKSRNKYLEQFLPEDE